MSNKIKRDQLSMAAGQRVKERDYWLTKLSGFRQKSCFPRDFNRKETAPHRMKTVTFGFSRQLSAALIKLSTDSDVRLHMILVAGLSALLHRHLQAYDHQGADAFSAAADGSDIVVGAPILRPDVEADFINTALVLRNPVHPHMTFKELLLGVRQTVTEALDHRNYPVEVLAEQLDMSCTSGEEFPLFDIAVVVENIHDKKFLHPLRLNMIFSFTRRDSVIEGCLEYNPLLYRDDTVSGIAAHFQRLLLSASAHLDTRVSALDLMSPEERERLLNQFNNTAADYPADKALHELFERQAQATPHRTAVVGTGFSLSYGELKERSDRVACLLREKGNAPNTIVGILTDRSLEMVIGIFSILKAGCAYLPIDPAYPGKRIDYILQDSGAKILLSDMSGVSEIGCNIEVIDLNKIIGPVGPIVPIPKELPTHPNHLCYIIYTSGSTGKPKGVMVEHRSVVNILFDQLSRYPFGENDTYLLKTSFVFDVSVTELFGWFMGGGRLAVLDKGAEKDPRKMPDAIREYRVTHLNFVPALFNAFVEILDPRNIGHLIHLKYLFLAGEKIRSELVKRFLARIGGIGCDIVLENIYGPTEATIYACGYSLSDWDGESDIPIGKPLGNVRLQILNHYGDVQPIGIPGELWIAGAGVARGYLNRPEYTSEKFYRAYKSYMTDISYKTGDIAMWLPNGNIAFLGRIDHQVKVRGFRIELGEIENHLLSHDSVKEVKVTALNTGTPGVEEETALCAYIVPEEPDGRLSISELREYLSSQLPDYMVPAYFVPLSDMPLAPTGKIDIKALPVPRIVGTGADYTAPRDAIEEKLVEVWKEVLNIGTASIGIEDNFFHLGGHSLKATTMVYRLYRELGVNLEIADVFDHPTIRGLARQVKDLKKEEYVEIVPVPEKDDYDLSFAQRRLWILCQFEEDSTAYNMPGAFTLSGPLNVAAFAGALQVLVDRHESLRTVFISVNGDPRQKVIPNLQCHLEQIDLRHLDYDAREEETRIIYRDNSNRAFDLENGPLFHFKLVRWEEESYVVIFNIHHIVSDGWSQGIIYNEIVRLYNSFSKNEENPLPPLKLQYKDYSRWHNRLAESNHFDQSRHYWLEKFKDKPNGIELPLDHSRRPIQTFNGGRINFTLDKEKTARLCRLNLQEDTTLFMSLLTLLNIFLFKYSGQRDIIIGSPIANRKRPELHHMVGFLVNTLIYRVQVDPDKSFRELLTETKQEALNSYRFQNYPFDLLVEELGLDRDMSQSPLFNVMLAHNNADTEDTGLQMEGVTVSEYSHHGDFNMSKFDLTFFMDEFDDQVSIRIEYNSDLFERSSIERMSGNFLHLVEHVLEGDSAGNVPVSYLSYLSVEEYEKVIHRFNRTQYTFSGLNLQELFEKQVEKSGSKTAAVFEHGDKIEKITYSHLNKRINQLAHYLKKKYQVKPNHIIAVSLDRSIDMIVVLWGIIKSGAAYVAVDPTYPRERVIQVLEGSRSNLLIIDHMRPELFGNYKGEILNITTRWDEMAQEPTENPEVVNSLSDILYVNYTSGSTGTPNGAMLSHDCLTNLIDWQNEKTGIDCSLRCLQFTSINFCVSFQEIMGTLTSGGQLYLIGDIERQDIDYLMDFLSRHQIEILFLPFSYLNFLFNESSLWNKPFDHNLKHIITAGEQLKITAGLKRFLDQNPGVQLHNHYGSTEMHVVTSYTLDASTAEKTPIPPAGKPIDNINIYILDEYLNPVPVGVFGELFVAGSSEILGYINNSALNEIKLVKHPVLSKNNMRLYRSGDIGRWLEDGNIELRGRKDFMVKIRGFRIDLGEIESKLLAVDRLKECVVVVKQDNKGQKYLLAYVVIENIGVEEIKNTIAKSLPRYMIPRLIVLEKLPLMPNGKVDRERLPEPADEEEEHVEPRNETDERLREIWYQLLDVKKIGIEDDFFEIGGHSLIVQKLISAVHKEFKVKLTFQDIFQLPTISAISDLISRRETTDHIEIEKQPKKDHYELSYSQKRLWFIAKREPNNPLFNMPLKVTLNEAVDAAVVREVLTQLMTRHESMRTYFKEVNMEPVQVIEPVDRIHVNIDLADWSELTESERENRRNRLLPEESLHIFNLEEAPLFRMKLVKCKAEEYDLVFNMHHIVSDGWSLEVLKQEFYRLYDACKKGIPPEIEPLTLQYTDYVAWQNQLLGDEEKIGKANEFWKSQLSGTLPILNLPYDFSPGFPGSKESAGYRFVVPETITNRLRRIVSTHHASLFMVLLAGFNILLSQVSGQKDIMIATPVAARQHDALKNIIGLFVNTLILRNHIPADEPFPVFFESLRQNTLKVLQYQGIPLELICGQLKIKYPEVSVFFNMINLGAGHRETLENVEPCHMEKVQDAKFDIVYYITEYKNGIEINSHYFKERFKPVTIEKLMDLYIKILDNISADPGKTIGEYGVTGKKRKLRRQP